MKLELVTGGGPAVVCRDGEDVLKKRHLDSHWVAAQNENQAEEHSSHRRQGAEASAGTRRLLWMD